MQDKKRGLGRGLDDLLSPGDWLDREDVQLFFCPVDHLEPNPHQPRQLIHNEAMDELAESIAEKGVIQPILAMRTDNPDRYRILAGERRWRAARQAGLTQVPVLLREATPVEALEIALIENIQRRDLNCIEEALAYQRLQTEFHLTQEEIARRVGKNRATVANLLRLLHLPTDIQEDVLNERLTMGHAKAILSLPDPQDRQGLRDIILARNLSVRQAEQMAQSLSNRSSSSASAEGIEDSAALRWQESLQARLQAPVRVSKRGARGTITIRFKSEDEFQCLLRRLGVEAPRET